jgi:hypothetical protein
MNRKEAAELLPIIKAFCEGKQIQFLFDEWKDVDEIGIREFLENPELYRIKPETKYRPFKDAEECWAEMQKHQPFGWIKCKEGYFNIVYVDDYYVGLADKDNSSILLASKNSYQDNIFADGTPFGVKEET